MKIPFLGHRHEKHGIPDPEGIAELLAECELLRSQASQEGVQLDDSAASLEALDQLLPRWRDDPEVLHWLGNDAGHPGSRQPARTAGCSYARAPTLPCRMVGTRNAGPPLAWNV